MSSTARTFAAALVALSLLCATAQGQRRATAPAAPARPPAAAASAAERKVPFQVGETLTYDVSWSSYLTAGVATLTVKDARPADGGSTAYYITGEGKPIGIVSSLYTLYYKADTMLDTRSLLPQRASIYSQEGNRRRTRTTIFNQAAQRADYEVKTGGSVKSSVQLPKYTQDALSALYALRAVPLKPNAGFTMPVCDGGKLYRVRFNIGAIETIRTATGSSPAFRISPVITDAAGRNVGRPITLWISADTRQVPLKLQADLAVGSVAMTLRGSL